MAKGRRAPRSLFRPAVRQPPFADYLEQNNEARGFGLESYPNLVMCRNNSLLEMNGQPYISALEKGWWIALVFNHENPIRILLELIWTRLQSVQEIHSNGRHVAAGTVRAFLSHARR